MRLRVDRDKNALVVTPDDETLPTREIPAAGAIDVGASGVLLGVEVRRGVGLPVLAEAFAGWGSAASVDGGAAYVELMAGDDSNARSAEVEVGVGLDADGLIASLTIPRRGARYEITYPSGNR